MNSNPTTLLPSITRPSNFCFLQCLRMNLAIFTSWLLATHTYCLFMRGPIGNQRFEKGNHK